MPTKNRAETSPTVKAGGSTGTEWLTIDEAAAYLKRPRRFVERLIAERRCRHFKHGKYVAFRKADLDEWATADCREALP